MGLAGSETTPLALPDCAVAALAALALLCAFQSLGHFFDHLSNRNVAIIRLPVDEIECFLSQLEHLQLMFATRGLSLAAARA